MQISSSTIVHNLIFQCPPLAAPTRAINPFCFNEARIRSHCRGVIPNTSAISRAYSWGVRAIMDKIFCSFSPTLFLRHNNSLFGLQYHSFNISLISLSKSESIRCVRLKISYSSSAFFLAC